MPDGIHHTRTEKLLLEAARIFNSTMEYEELIRLVLRLVINAVECEAALVYRLDSERPDMKIRLMKQPEFEIEEVRRQSGAGVIGWVAEHREPIIINDTSSR